MVRFRFKSFSAKGAVEKQNSFVVLLLIFYLVLINKLVAKKQAHPSH